MQCLWLLTLVFLSQAVWGIEPTDWIAEINHSRYQGAAQTEVKTDAGIADLISSSEVVHIASINDVAAGIATSKALAKTTQKKGVLALVIGPNDKPTAIRKAQTDGVSAGLLVLTLKPAVDQVQAEALASQQAQKEHAAKLNSKSKSSATASAQIQASPSKDKVTTSASTGYWLNSKTGTRHNSKCRYYQQGKNGAPCGPSDGKACKICGG